MSLRVAAEPDAAAADVAEGTPEPSGEAPAAPKDAWSSKKGRHKSAIAALVARPKWQYEHPRKGLRDYSEVECRRIEKFFRAGAWLMRLKSDMGKHALPGEIYFADMIQYDPATESTRRIRRVPELTRLGRLMRRLRAMWVALVAGESGWWISRTKAHFDEMRLAVAATAEETHAANYKVHSCMYKLVHSWSFSTFAALLIILNSFYVWVDADYNSGTTVEDTPLVFIVLDNFFVSWFTLEALARFCCYRTWRACFSDAWFLLDLALVALMIAETWALQFAVFYYNGGSGTPSEDLNKISILRSLRLMRLVRITSLFRVFPQLLILIKGMIAALGSLAYTLMLLFVLTYIFAIIFKNCADSTDALQTLNFDTVSDSFFNLLIYGTFMDSIGSLLNGLREVHPGYVALFLIYVFISALTLLNMLIGVLCEVLARVSEEEKGASEKAQLEHQLIDILDCYDIEDTRTLRKASYRHLLSNADFESVLKSHGIDKTEMTRLENLLFQPPEGEMEASHEAVVGFDVLIDKVNQLRRGTAATMSDIAELRNYLNKQFAAHDDHEHHEHHGGATGKQPTTAAVPSQESVGRVVASLPGQVGAGGGRAADSGMAAFQEAVLSQLQQVVRVQQELVLGQSALKASVDELHRQMQEVAAPSQYEPDEEC